MLKRVMFGFGMAVLLGLEAWAADALFLSQMESLKGATALTVDVSVKDGATHDVALESRIRVDTELRLRKAGILVVAGVGDDPPKALSFLKVTVLMLRNPGQRGTASSYEVARNALLSADCAKGGFLSATTWSKGSLGMNQDLDHSREIIGDLVDAFINDWLSANPPSAPLRSQ